jgi:hypothetical protein
VEDQQIDEATGGVVAHARDDVGVGVLS